MIGQSLFSIYYPAHAAILHGTRGLLVEGIGSSLNNLDQGAFRDTQPASAFSSLWGSVPSVTIPVQRLFRSEPASASLPLFLEAHSLSASSEKGSRGYRLSGKEDKTTAPDVSAAPAAVSEKEVGVPTLPGTSPGADTFDALVHALAAAGLAVNAGSPQAQLVGTVWLKAPEVTSGPIDSLEALRHVYYQMVVKEVASRATVEKYIPGAVMVEVDLTAGQNGEFQVSSLSLKKRTRVTSETEALDISDLPDAKNQLLFQAAKALARKAGVTGPVTVKFLFDPASKEIFFLKLK